MSTSLPVTKRTYVIISSGDLNMKKVQKTKSTVFLVSNLGIADKARGKGGGGEGGVSLWSRVSWSFVRGDSFASQSSRGRQGLRQL